MTCETTTKTSNSTTRNERSLGGVVFGDRDLLEFDSKGQHIAVSGVVV